MIIELIAWDFRDSVQDYAAWTIGIAALIWGGGPERAAAFTWLMLFELVPGAVDLFDDSAHFSQSIDVIYAIIDCIAAVSFVAIALFANRNYTMCIASMQLLAVCAHMASGIAEAISSAGYAVMVIAPGWVQLLLLAFGLVRHRLRKRRYGDYRDWRGPKPNPVSSPASDGPRLFTGVLSPSAAGSWRDRLK